MSCIGIRTSGWQFPEGELRFETHLSRLWEIGYRAIELVPESFDLIVGGSIDFAVLRKLEAILDRFEFCRTIHAPARLNLWNRDFPDMQEKVLNSSIELCRLLNGSILTIHTGSPYESFQLGRVGKPSHSELFNSELMDRERSVLLKAIESVENVKIGLENQRPYRTVSPWNYGEDMNFLAERIRSFDHPSIGLTFDTGHRNLAARYTETDPLQHFDSFKDLIIHTHLHDNHGIPNEPGDRDKSAHLPFGIGDEHRIPGCGTFSFEPFMAKMEEYSGTLLVELTDHYMNDTSLVESFDVMKRLLSQTKGAEYV